MSDKILRVSNIDAMVNTIKTHVEEINHTNEEIKNLAEAKVNELVSSGALQSQIITDKSINANEKIVDGTITKDLLDDNIKLELTEVEKLSSQIGDINSGVMKKTSNLLDPSKKIIGKSVFTWGTPTYDNYLMENSNWTTFNMIEANVGDIVYFYQGNTTVKVFVNVFNKDKTFSRMFLVGEVDGVLLTGNEKYVVASINTDQFPLTGEEHIELNVNGIGVTGKGKDMPFVKFGYEANVYNKTEIDLKFENVKLNENKITKNLLPLGLTVGEKHTCITPGEPGSFDDGKIESPNVWWDENKLMYGMLYVGYKLVNEQVDYASIGLAWSKDLLTWTKETTPILTPSNIEGTPDYGSVTAPFMYYENGIYYLFYLGCSQKGYERGDKRLCIAYGNDLHNLTRYEHNPIITTSGWDGQNWYTDQIYHPYVMKWNKKYYCFFNAYGRLSLTDDNSIAERIGYAESDDLFNWIVNEQHLIDVSVDGFDSYIAGDPYIYDIGDDNLYMAYFGATKGSETKLRDGLAYTKKANFPHAWSKYEGNPITTNGIAKPCIVFRGGEQYHFFGCSGLDGSIGFVKSL